MKLFYILTQNSVSYHYIWIALLCACTSIVSPTQAFCESRLNKDSKSQMGRQDLPSPDLTIQSTNIKGLEGRIITLEKENADIKNRLNKLDIT